MKRSVVFALLASLLLIFAFGTLASAAPQNSIGSITGTVLDNTPAIIPGAVVNVTDGAGVTRGLAQAGAAGVWIARAVSERKAR